MNLFDVRHVAEWVLRKRSAMPASKLNYLVLYVGESQVYGTSSKQVALESPPPPGVPLENKRVGFITFEPDSQVLTYHPLPIEEVLEAEIKQPKKKDENG